MKAAKAKAKTKKKFPNKDSPSTSGSDLSHLCKPIDISVSSLLQVMKLLQTGSYEVKSILAHECDVVYECRVCRSLFRSLANLISHKRVYCREKFNVTHGMNSYHVIADETVTVHPESVGDLGLMENIQINQRKGGKKVSKTDITSVIDSLRRMQDEDSEENSSKSRNSCKDLSNRVSCDPATEAPVMVLEGIESTPVAVYQTAVQSTLPAVPNTDLMKAQVIELDDMMSKSTAVIAPDGSVEINQEKEKSDNPVQIYGSDDDESMLMDVLCPEDSICSVCNAKFATRKTLTLHMKTLHMSYRMCYPCPCCTSTFANTWSVYRHLFKIHRKSNEQVRKLRTQIQEKAFRKETTGAEDLETESVSNKSSETTDRQTNDETQEWMEQFELDIELQRCGGCGRRFDRRAALISHSQICQKRIAACNDAANKTKRSVKTPSPEKAIDNNNQPSKETCNNSQASVSIPTTKVACKKLSSQSLEKKTRMISGDVLPEPTTPDASKEKEMTIRVQDVASLSTADWEMINASDPNGMENGVTSSNRPRVDIMNYKELEHKEDVGAPIASRIPDSPEVIYTSIDQSRTVAISFGTKRRRLAVENESANLLAITGGDNEAKSSAITIGNSVDNKLTRDRVTMMESGIATIANLRKLECLLCRRKFTSMTNLRRHMAIHIGWNRYRCKLCDFKCFVKCDCVAHCNKIHNAKNNRAIIADMVVQIPLEQRIVNQDIVMDITGSDESNESVGIPQGDSVVDPNIVMDITGSDESNPEPEVIECKTTPSPGSSSNFDPSNGRSTTNMDQKQKATDHQLVNETCDELSLDIKEEDVDEVSHEALGNLNKDPDLRRMVMEVIFGTVENSSGEDATKDATVPKTKGKARKAAKKKVVKNKVAKPRRTTEAPRKRYLKPLPSLRPQRPTRNRVTPIDKDFIYDLKDAFDLRESLVRRITTSPANESSTVKQSSQRQASNSGTQSADKSPPIPESSQTPKMPSLVIYRKEEIVSNYEVKETRADKSREVSIVSSIVEPKEVFVCGQK